MPDDSVKRWIKKKLDNGISEDRIKKTLEKTGRDPSLVDEVNSPFDGDPDSEEKDTTQDKSGEDGSADDPFDSLKYVEHDEETSDGGSEKQEVSESSENGDQDSGEESSFSLPSVQLPSVSSPDIGVRKAVPVVAILLISGLGMGAYQMFGDSVKDTTQQVSEALGPQCSGDIGTGIKVYDVRTDGSSTTADVFVEERATVILEVMSGDERTDSVKREMEGDGSVTVSAVGDRVLFHELGCEEPVVERGY